MNKARARAAIEREGHHSGVIHYSTLKSGYKGSVWMLYFPPGPSLPVHSSILVASTVKAAPYPLFPFTSSRYYPHLVMLCSSHKQPKTFQAVSIVYIEDLQTSQEQYIASRWQYVHIRHHYL